METCKRLPVSRKKKHISYKPLTDIRLDPYTGHYLYKTRTSRKY